MIVHLVPTSRFLGGLPRSDTLFGALCWGIRWTHGEAVLLDLLDACGRGEPLFVLSSAFPVAEGKGQEVYYLPRPLFWPHAVPGKHLEDLARDKRVRRVAWVSQTVFMAIAAGRPPAVETLRVEAGFVGMPGEAIPGVRTTVVDRNTINRVTGAVQEGRLFFGEETGVEDGAAYFLIAIRRPAARGLVKAALRFLEDRGIGGDASVGRGQVKIAWEDGDLLPPPGDAAHRVSLSLLHPSARDRDHLTAVANRSAYRLEKRKGRVESLYAPTEQPWKSTLVMLVEGSAFPADGTREVYGAAPVVKEQPFRIRHNGFGYMVGCTDVA